MFKQFSFVFFLLFFHELGHAIIGLIFNWKIIKITFYPYGGLTLFSKLENSSINEEIIILLSGPVMQIITYYILIYLFPYDYIRTYHLTILFFNLLPILNLDGGKLLNLILNKVFNYKTSFIISSIMSFLTIIVLMIISFKYYYNLNLFLMNIFLFFKTLKLIKEYKFCYHKFLLERYLYNINYSKNNVSKDIYSFYREYSHYIDFQKEKAYLEKYFDDGNNNFSK